MKWKNISTAPQDGTPILGWCNHKAEPYYLDKDESILTIYGAHDDALSHVSDGPHVVVWGGAYDEGEWSVPDWWFLFGSDFDVVANPTHWIPIPCFPKEGERKYEMAKD
jgi:hypothetical protein